MLTVYVGHHVSWHPGQIWLLYEILGEMEHEGAPWEHTRTKRVASVLLTCPAHYNFTPGSSQAHFWGCSTSKYQKQLTDFLSPKTKRIGTSKIFPVATLSNKGVLKYF